MVGSRTIAQFERDCPREEESTTTTNRTSNLLEIPSKLRGGRPRLTVLTWSSGASRSRHSSGEGRAPAGGGATGDGVAAREEGRRGTERRPEVDGREGEDVAMAAVGSAARKGSGGGGGARENGG